MNSSLKCLIQKKPILSSLQVPSLLTHQSLTYYPIRCSGGHGHSDHHYHFDQSPSA
jgi:hypothetical protein